MNKVLKWVEQVLAIFKKVSRAVGFLKYAKSSPPKDSLMTLYRGIVEPHFQYCCSVWGCCGSTDITKLQKLQNRAARVLTDSSFDAPSRPLIEKLGWKTIEDFISEETTTMVFKSLHELAPEYLCCLFTSNTQFASHNLRNTATDLKLPKIKSTNGQNCFSYRGAKLWNSLPAESKQASSLSRFKSSLYI